MKKYNLQIYNSEELFNFFMSLVARKFIVVKPLESKGFITMYKGRLFYAIPLVWDIVEYEKSGKKKEIFFDQVFLYSIRRDYSGPVRRNFKWKVFSQYRRCNSFLSNLIPLDNGEFYDNGLLRKFEVKYSKNSFELFVWDETGIEQLKLPFDDINQQEPRERAIQCEIMKIKHNEQIVKDYGNIGNQPFNKECFFDCFNYDGSAGTGVSCLNFLARFPYENLCSNYRKKIKL